MVTGTELRLALRLAFETVSSWGSTRWRYVPRRAGGEPNPPHPLGNPPSIGTTGCGVKAVSRGFLARGRVSLGQFPLGKRPSILHRFHVRWRQISGDVLRGRLGGKPTPTPTPSCRTRAVHGRQLASTDWIDTGEAGQMSVCLGP